jgi:hypothetical protein
VNGRFTVEAGNRWDAVALLRLLASYHPWTIQLGEDRWLVVGRADDDTAQADALRLVDRWAVDRGHEGVSATMGLDALGTLPRLGEAQ